MTDYYVLKAGYKWVSLDGVGSDSYPEFLDEVRYAHVWTSKEEALKYSHKFKDKKFVLHTLTYSTVETYVSPGDLARASGDKEYAEFIRLSQKFGAAGELKCKFEKCWVGQCKKATIVGEEYCPEHLGMKCFQCKGQATHDCEATMGAFVCGTPMCANHSHHH